MSQLFSKILTLGLYFTECKLIFPELSSAPIYLKLVRKALASCSNKSYWIYALFQ